MLPKLHKLLVETVLFSLVFKYSVMVSIPSSCGTNQRHQRIQECCFLGDLIGLECDLQGLLCLLIYERHLVSATSEGNQGTMIFSITG